MKIRRGGARTGPPGSLAPPPAGNVGAGLLNGEQRFFEPQSLASQELPHRIVRDLDLACGRFGLQAMKRQMGVWPSRSMMNVRCGSRTRLQCPPILPGATKPVAR
jgi:hypothetical protein